MPGAYDRSRKEAVVRLVSRRVLRLYVLVA
jgi:hypothetical protein